MASNCQHSVNHIVFYQQFLLLMNKYTTVYNIPLCDTYKHDILNFLQLITTDAHSFHNNVYADFPNLENHQKILLKNFALKLFKSSRTKFNIGKSLLAPPSNERS